MGDLFEGLDKKTVTGNQRHPSLTVGEGYVVQVEDVIWLEGRKGDAFIVEMSIVESPDHTAHPIGSMRSWYQSFKNDRDVAQSEVLKFMYACTGYDAKRDKERIEKEVTPNIKKWTFAAVNRDAEKGPVKVMNGKVRLRVSVWKKPPNEKALLKNPQATGWDTLVFRPMSNEPPPARAAA